MIANQTLGRGFVGLGSYLLTGRDRVDPSQRVGWIEHRNLPTERLDIAIRIMAGTASLSYTKRPVFHLSISFAPGNPVDAALMKRVMVRTLSDLGLGEHQAVMVAHIDTDDPHVHAMVNRVHPETGVAWKGSWSRLRVEASLRQQELEEGLQVVPGWLAPVPGHPELRPRPRLAHGDEEFLREVQDRAGPVLERARARSWADVEAGLAEFGLSVRVNGRGMSITDGRREVKASEVGRQFSRGNLEKSLGRYSDYSARVAVASAASVRDPGAASPTPASIESKAYPENSTTSEAQPRFSLYEDGEIVGVWDCIGPRIFFAEMRERAEEEMQRANWLAARYPNIRVVRCLRDMDGEWRDTRGLPRLPEENGRPLRRRAPPARTEPSPPLPAPAEFAPAAPSLEAPARPLEPVAAPEIIVEPPTGTVVADPDHPIALEAEHSGPAPAPVREYASFLDEVRSQAEPALRLSEPWAQLEHDLAEFGLFLRVKGGGFVVTDGQREVKASEVGREFSRFYLEKRLGRYPHPPMPVVAADVVPAASIPAAQPEAPAQHDLPEPRWQAAAPHEAEELADAPQFTLYEDEGIFGVFDSAGPQVFFAETRQRALEEVERANAIIARYPNTISMRHLRDMDGAWRDARGLPRLPEPEGPTISVFWADSMPAEDDPAPAARAGTTPADEVSAPAPMVECAAEQVGTRAEPIRDEVEDRHHGPEPKAHRAPDQAAHERKWDGGRDVADEGRPDLRKNEPLQPTLRIVHRAHEDPSVEEAVRAFATLEDVRTALAQGRALRAERNQAEQVLATLDQPDGALTRTERDFRATAEAVYRNSVAAMAAWNRLVDSEEGSLESAAERVTKSPELLGPLLTEPHSSVWGPAAAKLGFASARVAREAVPQMLRRAVLYARALREATKPVEWTAPDGETVHGRAKVRSRARTVVLDRIAKIEAADARIWELGGITGAEREVQRAFAGLSPAQRSRAEREIAAGGAAKGITASAIATTLAEVLAKVDRFGRAARSVGEGPGSL